MRGVRETNAPVTDAPAKPPAPSTNIATAAPGAPPASRAPTKKAGKAAMAKPWRRRFPPTREGWWFLIATLLVGAAAVNAGLNLLFLVFGMMLFLILASGVLSEMCLGRLTVERRPPAAVHAGTPFLMGISVRNDKTRVPTFSLEVEDLLGERVVERRCYFLKIPAGRQQETAYRHTLPRRGLHQLSGFRISTRFPFGLIRKSRDLAAVHDLVVYPALVPVPDAVLPASLIARNADSDARPSRSGDFQGLREFREGDDPRHVHWRSSARRGRLLVRESEDESGRELYVALLAPTRDAETGAPFEAAVSMAASLAVRLLARGFSLGLLLGDEVTRPSTGAPASADVLRRLALVTPVEAIDGGHDIGAALFDAAPSPRLGALPPGATVLRVRPHKDRPMVDIVTMPGARRTA